jgi:hypothetical protein
MFAAMIDGTPFPEPCPPVSGEEVAETLRTAIVHAGRLPRSADMLLCRECATYLIDELHGAGMAVVRASPGQGQ